MRKDIKVKLTLSKGYADRFTKACIQVAKKRVENREKVIHTERAKEVAAAG